MTGRIKILITTIILSAGSLLLINRLFFSTANFFLGVPVKTQIGIERHLFDKVEEDPDMSLINYGGNPVPYDEDTKTIYLPVNIKSNSWDKILTSDSGNMYFTRNPLLRRGNKKSIVANGEALELYHVTDTTFSKMNVILTGMPIISINNWHDISKAHWGGSIEIFDPESVGREYQGTTCDYYIRGNFSRIYPKSSYRVTLSEKKLSLCGLRKDDDWILNSLFDDLGYVRNRISYTLWNEMSASNGVTGDETVECAYVELIRNHKYEGLYLLSDRIDPKKTGITKKDILYKQRDWPKAHNEESFWDVFLISYPDDYGEDEIKLMTDFMFEIYEPDEHETGYEQFSDKLYMDNAVDYELFCMFLCAGDNLFKNCYVAAIKQPDDSYKLMQIPWDTNGTFGVKGGHVEYDSSRIEMIETSHSIVGATLEYYDEDAFYELCCKRWKELRKTVFSEKNVTELAAEYIEYIENTGAYKRNVELWPTFTRPDYEGMERDITEMWKKEDLYNFIHERGELLDKYYGYTEGE